MLDETFKAHLTAAVTKRPAQSSHTSMAQLFTHASLSTNPPSPASSCLQASAVLNWIAECKAVVLLCHLHTPGVSHESPWPTTDGVLFAFQLVFNFQYHSTHCMQQQCTQYALDVAVEIARVLAQSCLFRYPPLDALSAASTCIHTVIKQNQFRHWNKSSYWQNLLLARAYGGMLRLVFVSSKKLIIFNAVKQRTLKTV